MQLFVFQVCSFLDFRRSFQYFLYLNWHRLWVLIIVLCSYHSDVNLLVIDTRVWTGLRQRDTMAA